MNRFQFYISSSELKLLKITQVFWVLAILKVGIGY